MPVNYPTTIEDTLLDKSLLYKRLDILKRFGIKYNVPIYIGEFSVVRWAPHNDALQWIRDCIDYFEEAGWLWTYFHFREDLEGKIFDLEYSESKTNQVKLSTESDAAALLKTYLSLNNQ